MAIRRCPAQGVGTLVIWGESLPFRTQLLHGLHLEIVADLERVGCSHRNPTAGVKMEIWNLSWLQDQRSGDGEIAVIVFSLCVLISPRLEMRAGDWPLAAV
jgi:hypothetical protein